MNDRRDQNHCLFSVIKSKSWTNYRASKNDQCLSMNCDVLVDGGGVGIT